LPSRLDGVFEVEEVARPDQKRPNWLPQHKLNGDLAERRLDAALIESRNQPQDLCNRRVVARRRLADLVCQLAARQGLASDHADVEPGGTREHRLLARSTLFDRAVEKAGGQLEHV